MKNKKANSTNEFNSSINEVHTQAGTFYDLKNYPYKQNFFNQNINQIPVYNFDLNKKCEVNITKNKKRLKKYDNIVYLVIMKILK